MTARGTHLIGELILRKDGAEDIRAQTISFQVINADLTEVKADFLTEAEPATGYRLVIESAGSTSNAIDGFEVVERTNLRLRVEDEPEQASAGQEIDLNVRVSKLRSLHTARNVVAQTMLPQGLTLVSTQGCGEDPVGVPVCSLGDIERLGEKEYSIKARLDSEIPTGTTVTISATVSSDNLEVSQRTTLTATISCW